MTRTELFDKLLKHLYDNKDSYWNVDAVSEQYFKISDRKLLESIVDEMIEKDWVKPSNHSKWSLTIAFEGIDFIDKNESYAKYLEKQQKNDNKERLIKSTDTGLNIASKIAAIGFGITTIIFAYLSYSDRREINKLKDEILNFELKLNTNNLKLDSIRRENVLLKDSISSLQTRTTRDTTKEE